MSEITQESYPRFRIGARIEHFILLVSFTTLAVTGLPQKYVNTALGEGMIDIMGGIETVRIIHRWAAAILTAGSVYHIFTATYRFYVKHERLGMLPDLKDLTDMRDFVLYNLGINSEHPRMRKFNFGEKFEYWAVVWGTAVMILTGFMLLNPVATTSILPGSIIPAALAAHGWEALLAVSAIIIWHLYNVLIKHFNPSIWTGKMPRHQMLEEHALELERLEAGGQPWPELELQVRRRRLRRYVLFTVLVGGLLLFLTYWSFTFEETAIQTIPRVTREVFVPLATTTP